jgi:hypothetical protein
MHERMNERMDECMNKGKHSFNARAKECMNESTYERMNGRRNE